MGLISLVSRFLKNLPSSGGTGQYLKQASTGAPITVGSIAAADVPNLFPNPSLRNSPAIGTAYQNTTSQVLFVMVSAYRTSGNGGSMFLNTAAASGSLPATNAGGNGTSLGQVSFGVGGNSYQIVGVVPPNWYYNVTTDSSFGFAFTFWAEA